MAFQLGPPTRMLPPTVTGGGAYRTPERGPVMPRTQVVTPPAGSGSATSTAPTPAPRQPPAADAMVDVGGSVTGGSPGGQADGGGGSSGATPDYGYDYGYDAQSGAASATVALPWWGWALVALAVLAIVRR